MNTSTRISARCALDYNLAKDDTLTGAYTIDDGTSLIPLADPLFASFTPLRMQVASLNETHIFSPASSEYGRRSDFPAHRSRWIPCCSPAIPANLSFVQGLGPGGIVVGGGATTTANGTITSAGPNNAAGVNESPQSFHVSGRSADQQRHAPVQRRRVVSAAAG